MIESKCGGKAGPATDTSAPNVFALSGVIGGAANLGSATAKIFGCAFRATRKPLSEFAFSCSEDESLSMPCNKSGTIFATASFPPFHRFIALKATPPASWMPALGLERQISTKDVNNVACFGLTMPPSCVDSSAQSKISASA